MIVKRGKKFIVMDSKGKKVLGTHDTEKEAENQLTAIHISQHKNESTILNFSDFISEQLMTLEYHEELNPKFWENDELKPEVREKLIQIGNAFISWSKIPQHAVKDYIFVGGNANFNYTTKSDVDLHIIVDPNEISDCSDFIEDYFEDKKDLWSLKHDINLYGQKVEIALQDEDAKYPENQGVFSVIKNEWLSKPVNQNLDLKNIPEKEKASELKDEIDALLMNSVDPETIKAVKEKIKNMRRTSISKHGEFGHGNLIFKELRNLGYFEKMNDYMRSMQDKDLSL